ncbi:MAG: hypothetical protein ACXAC6_00995 [Candidatus Hodarchaeales archaeon]
MTNFQSRAPPHALYRPDFPIFFFSMMQVFNPLEADVCAATDPPGPNRF